MKSIWILIGFAAVAAGCAAMPSASKVLQHGEEATAASGSNVGGLQNISTYSGGDPWPLRLGVVIGSLAAGALFLLTRDVILAIIDKLHGSRPDNGKLLG